MKITIKNTLLSALAMLGGLLLISDASGLNALLEIKDGLKSVYDDRVVPLRDLKIISDSYAVSIVDASHKIRNGNTGLGRGGRIRPECQCSDQQELASISGNLSGP